MFKIYFKMDISNIIGTQTLNLVLNLKIVKIMSDFSFTFNIALKFVYVP